MTNWHRFSQKRFFRSHVRKYKSATANKCYIYGMNYLLFTNALNFLMIEQKLLKHLYIWVCKKQQNETVKELFIGKAGRVSFIPSLSSLLTEMFERFKLAWIIYRNGEQKWNRNYVTRVEIDKIVCLYRGNYQSKKIFLPVKV